MATLREAVESGRRWRFKSSAYWHTPAPGSREWDLSPAAWARLSEMVEGEECEIEPEPEKPREWVIHLEPTGNCGRVHELPCSYSDSPNFTVRVHDAEACDRLRGAK
jgi:hypothetical protein